MTREEAIEVLNGILHLNYRNFWDEECDEAIDMAIEALSEVRCNDCKWNDDVIEVVRCKDCKHLYEDNGCPLRTWHTHVLDDYCSYGELKGCD